MLLHLLTAAAIFVHATLGCCAHEAHEVSETISEPSTCSCHCEHHHSPQDDLSEESGESPEPVPHECNHTNCEWPAPETRNDDDLLTLDFTGILPSTSTNHVRISSRQRFRFLPSFGRSFFARATGARPSCALRLSDLMVARLSES